ncbi:MAG: UDP-N-acetylglucosamine 1-carboxyvinyltransferase [Desulfobacterales bacterium]|nr:UDP-N-acetylglucosamine 1-carboxyvinyltransferase [Desulfobacterales bacterium]MCP4163608.1 UDP-N-acetylglucosamine 1-carboxyvinyltransferase [Deltaproteobacteria bacterium]
MTSYEIIGGKPLAGTITPQGAKNEALQIVAAVLLTNQPVLVHNIPDIIDVNKIIELIEGMGVFVENRGSGTFLFHAENIDTGFFTKEEYLQCAGALRGSVLLIGAMLFRLGCARIPNPGGDKIGRRPLDTHFSALSKLGATVHYDSKNMMYEIDGKNLKGSYIHLGEPSVTGTANLVMAALRAKGTTTIYNAACEPYIQQLCKMLNSMGAKISGIGSNLLSIVGVDELSGCEHTVLPDMIEIGSFIGLAAMTSSEITIQNCRVDMLGLIPDVFRKLGIIINIKDDTIHIPKQDRYEIETLINGSILTIYDAPWPGFTPDLLSILLVVATQAKGSVLIHQKMFESRLFFVDKLIDMGSQIILCDPHRATVIGLDKQVPLRGIRMTSPDIRAGVALLIAALAAEGTSIIENVHQIDRGYERIDERLNNLGADIKRLE